MKKLVYYVALSLDGYIAGKDEDVSLFIYSGEGVTQYLDDLKTFNAVLMGRTTYEFGYKFGAVPGEPSPAYPFMKHYIISDSLSINHPQIEILRADTAQIQKIKAEESSDIYVCGGGKLAGWLLQNQLLDIVKVKVNPVILGQGIKLFEGLTSPFSLQIEDSRQYPDGMILSTYNVKY